MAEFFQKFATFTGNFQKNPGRNFSTHNPTTCIIVTRQQNIPQTMTAWQCLICRKRTGKTPTVEGRMYSLPGQTGPGSIISFLGHQSCSGNSQKNEFRCILSLSLCNGA